MAKIMPAVTYSSRSTGIFPRFLPFSNRFVEANAVYVGLAFVADQAHRMARKYECGWVGCRENRANQRVSAADARRLSGIVRPVPASVLDFGTVMKPRSITPFFQTRLKSFLCNARISAARSPVSSVTIRSGSSAGDLRFPAA